MARGSLSAGRYRLRNGGSGTFVPRPCENRVGARNAFTQVQADGHGAGQGRAVQGCEQASVPEDWVSGTYNTIWNVITNGNPSVRSDEPILCISKELACDGIRHCPYSNEYDSDEDYELCYKQRRPGAGTLPSALESDLFEQFALEVFRNLFAYDAPTSPEDMPPRNGSAGETEAAAAAASAGGATAAAGVNSNSTTQLRKVHTKDMKKPDPGSPNAIGTQFATELDGKAQDNDTVENGIVNGSGAGSGFTRRNSTRSGLHSDLSKYGPWGYLMLGMLLCGGALLICGLWGTFNCTLL